MAHRGRKQQALARTPAAQSRCGRPDVNPRVVGRETFRYQRAGSSVNNGPLCPAQGTRGGGEFAFLTHPGCGVADTTCNPAPPTSGRPRAGGRLCAGHSASVRAPGTE